MKATFRFLICAFVSAAGALAQTPARTNPKPVGTPLPAYPEALFDTGKSGGASIDVLVKADGSVADARVKSADDDAFAVAAMAVVGNWRFEPGTREGVAADMRVVIPFKFAAPAEQQLNVIFKRKVYQKLTEPVLEAKDYGQKLKLKTEAPPVYPRALAGSGTVEKVQVTFVVAPDGTTLNPVITGQPRKEFILSALTAVVHSVYEPPVKDGKGVYVSASRTLRIEPPARAKRGGRGGGDGGGDFGGGGGIDPDGG